MSMHVHFKYICIIIAIISTYIGGYKHLAQNSGFQPQPFCSLMAYLKHVEINILGQDIWSGLGLGMIILCTFLR